MASGTLGEALGPRNAALMGPLSVRSTAAVRLPVDSAWSRNSEAFRDGAIWRGKRGERDRRELKTVNAAIILKPRDIMLINSATHGAGKAVHGKIQTRLLEQHSQRDLHWHVRGS